jgi:hypothetical protein
MKAKERERKLAQPVSADEFSNHAAYIKSGYWEARKELYFERNPSACAVCDSPYVELHHMFYGDFGQEPDSDLIPLCRRDHEAFHASIGGSTRDMREATRRFVVLERDRLKRIAIDRSYAGDPAGVDKRIETLLESIAAPVWRLFDKLGL